MDEVLAADYKLVAKAKKAFNIAGTSALMTIIHNQYLAMVNVGNLQGVIFGHKEGAISLSFDHKLQQVREHKRIHKTAGLIAFRGQSNVS